MLSAHSFGYIYHLGKELSLTSPTDGVLFCSKAPREEIEVSTATIPKANVSFEKELLNMLRFGGLHEDNLKDLVRAVAGLHANGMDKVRVFPKGIPVPTGVTVECILDRSKLDLISKILQETPRCTSVVVFPYGIPYPDVFGVNANIGVTNAEG
jgi:hypothetical protein